MHVRRLALFLLLPLLLAGASYSFAAEATALTASLELQKLFKDDQADREPAPGVNVDWEAIGLRDEQRELRIKELIAAGVLVSGADFYHAAMVLQHAPTPDDALLAHDLCVIAIGKGEKRAKWLAAASMDRFLIRVGRQQRFGTQAQSTWSRPPQLVPVDPNVSDALRREFDVPDLADKKKELAEMARIMAENKKKAAPK